MADLNSTALVAREDRLIERAAGILERRFLAVRGPKLDNASAAKHYVALKLSRYRREVFLAIWVDAKIRVIEIEEVSRGTLFQTVIYPREMVRSAIEKNAAGVIIAHNHPAGSLEFSAADRELTERLRETLKLIDVRVLDHLLVADGVASLVQVEAREALEREEIERVRREEQLVERRAKREEQAAARRAKRAAKLA